MALKHAGVLKAAAFPVADERLGGRVPRRHLARRRSAGGRPDSGHFTSPAFQIRHAEHFIALDAFPLTASGKILKRELVEWVKSGRISPVPALENENLGYHREHRGLSKIKVHSLLAVAKVTVCRLNSLNEELRHHAEPA
jgi:hypothetical protein